MTIISLISWIQQVKSRNIRHEEILQHLSAEIETSSAFIDHEKCPVNLCILLDGGGMKGKKKEFHISRDIVIQTDFVFLETDKQTNDFLDTTIDKLYARKGSKDLLFHRSRKSNSDLSFSSQEESSHRESPIMTAVCSQSDTSFVSGTLFNSCVTDQSQNKVFNK